MTRQIRITILHAAAVVAAGVLCGSAANLLRPDRIPWIEDWGSFIEAKALRENIALVDAAEAHELVRAGRHLLFDARPPADYEAGHLPGALSVPFDGVEEAMLRIQSRLSAEQPVVTYCSGQSCDESFELTKYLRVQGFTNVVLFAGGMDAWKAAGYPVEEGPR